jgi:hypothetical protein
MVSIYFDALKKVRAAIRQPGSVAKAIGATAQVAAEGSDPVRSGRLICRCRRDDNVPLLFFQIWKGDRVLIQPEKFSTGEFRLPAWMTSEAGAMRNQPGALRACPC